MLRCTLAGAVVVLGTSAAFAAVHTTQLPTTEFGHIDQNHPSVNLGDVACGPTAVVNSFLFLENHYPSITGLTDSDPIDTINSLEGAGYMNTSRPDGTTIQNLIAGKSTWITEHNLEDQIAIEGQTFFVTGDTRIQDNTKPTLAFLFEQLNKGQDVEILFSWWNGAAYNGGHYVTVTGLTYDDADSTGSLSIIDPWDGVDITGSLSTHNGFIQLTYAGGAAADPDDPDNPEHLSSGDITSVIAESPIPAPATIVLLLMTSGITAHRRRR